VLEFHASRELNLTTTARVGCRVVSPRAAPGEMGDQTMVRQSILRSLFELLVGLGHVVGSVFVFLMQLDRGGRLGVDAVLRSSGQGVPSCPLPPSVDGTMRSVCTYAGNDGLPRANEGGDPVLLSRVLCWVLGMWCGGWPVKRQMKVISSLPGMDGPHSTWLAPDCSQYHIREVP
jgi:hypothetical protein